MHELSGDGSCLVDEHQLFLGSHALEDRNVVDVFFKLGNVVAADDDVRNGLRAGETQKGFHAGVPGQARRFAAKGSLHSDDTRVFTAM